MAQDGETCCHWLLWRHRTCTNAFRVAEVGSSAASPQPSEILFAVFGMPCSSTAFSQSTHHHLTPTTPPPSRAQANITPDARPRTVISRHRRPRPSPPHSRPPVLYPSIPSSRNPQPVVPSIAPRTSSIPSYKCICISITSPLPCLLPIPHVPPSFYPVPPPSCRPFTAPSAIPTGAASRPHSDSWAAAAATAVGTGRRRCSCSLA